MGSERRGRGRDGCRRPREFVVSREFVVTKGSAGFVPSIVSGVVCGSAARHHASMNATVVGEDLVELEIVRSQPS